MFDSRNQSQDVILPFYWFDIAKANLTPKAAHGKLNGGKKYLKLLFFFSF